MRGWDLRRISDRTVRFAFTAILLSLVAGCGGGGGNSGGSTQPPPPTITSVSVSCLSSVLPTGQTNQCSATVSGTGNYNSSVSWSVGGTAGGNGTLGTISARSEEHTSELQSLRH